MKKTAQTAGNTPLLTDFYQLTMAYSMWKTGLRKKEGVYHLFFRNAPFGGNFCVASGIGPAIDFLTQFSFSEDDISYLASLKDSRGAPYFEKEYLEYLKEMKLSCDVDAVPEGTPVFPFEPILRVQGPIDQCQLLETALLNHINFPSLVATKAARISDAAGEDPVLEFGLRRAQGMNGGLAASRAAYVGGCTATSNVLAGREYGIPVKGTIAHSWVMAFEDELDAFNSYASVMPGNSVLLVDTYSTLPGVKNAVKAGHILKRRGYTLDGIRLDSGDLAYLSKEARKILDREGFESTKILASNDLDEHIIQSLKQQGARIDIWGVGTKLATAYDHPALDGIYKLSAVRNTGEEWTSKIKLSEQAVKISNPGILQTRRYTRDGYFSGDAIYDIYSGINDECTIIDPFDPTKKKSFSASDSHIDLLVPVLRNGECVYNVPELPEIRQYAALQRRRLHPSISRLLNPHSYPAGLESGLYAKKQRLIQKMREKYIQGDTQ